MYAVWYNNNHIGYFSSSGNLEQATKRFYSANPEYKKIESQLTFKKL